MYYFFGFFQYMQLQAGKMPTEVLFIYDFYAHKALSFGLIQLNLIIQDRLESSSNKHYQIILKVLMTDLNHSLN